MHGHQAAYPLVDFSARTTALSIASMEDSKDDSVSSVQPAFLLVAKHRIYKCGMHDLCLKIFRWLCIRSLTADAEGLLKSSTDEGAKSAIKKVYEAVRYSDPVSSTALAPLENEIDLKFSDLTDAVNQNEPDKIVCIANEITDLLAERSRSCKMFKS